MAIKELSKSVKPVSGKSEHDVDKFISKGGSLAKVSNENVGDHRLTLRIPSSLMDKVDIKRRERVGKISRNLWILEVIEKATQG